MKHVRGPLCTIDVGEQTVETESIDEVLESSIGGRALGTSLAHERIPFDADPLGPENRLYFATGPLQHSTMSFTGRMSATGVSPLTDGLLSSNAGGFLSRNFTGTGYSAVEITGSSDDLVIVHVTDEGVEFEDVSDLAEATVPETCSYIEDEHGLDAEHTVVIGPSGENEVRFASIMTSEERAFGRGGLGAVLGSKNVKAITFEGDSTHEVEIPPLQMDVHREAAQSDHIMKRQGTSSMTEYANTVEALPTRYFSELSFEGAEGINGDRVEEKKYKKGTCSACAFACKLPTKDEEAGFETEGPEYETVMAFGSNSGVDDIVDVMKSNKLCDELGLDTISAGDVVAAYLASEDEFGNVDLIHETVEEIAHREGIGDDLAEGIDRVHDDLGVDNWSVKGMEFPAHDGRTLNGQGLSFATSNRGADHMYAEFYPYEYPLVDAEKAFSKDGLEDKPPKIIELENINAIKDSAVLCKFSRDFMTNERMETLLDADYEELLALGGETVALERHFNNQRGFDREDDSLPYDVPGFEQGLDEYYEERGWNEDGTVPASALESSGSDAAPADD
ncbi:aldehyde ferredoxin oxidoreductase [Natrialba magadii ATCC 43099]|uniref:Aldehyde ferredoxin oxidoreductase n=1 Tax=Natrialba magadii (strain ATCC 43099 / DSM 3394 / CCM 3739 / CIP 104546 / IAM 13178 / JCM 8861 / NBRC 102185 / NCIMB 2190 / MS3) TaxID=547559 RepID=D3SW26_NATMM|nr:aldehyde ferredoxin oxidoreductase C-terminal domain-containing protein [Natrialba magadii]ADD05687.1 aldehyde ferredoxin oxidoreductase [Natrialba magadii ATCC 43099]ELY29901.1 aldehyde ferredoxin oxidoreductase [Natrialba magadii ATCC 43099]